MSVFITIISILYIYLYHVLYTVYFVSHQVIAYAHVYYSLMFNNVILHNLCSCLFFTYVYNVSVEVVLLLLSYPSSIVSHSIPSTVYHCQTLNNYLSILMGGSRVSGQLVPL